MFQAFSWSKVAQGVALVSVLAFGAVVVGGKSSATAKAGYQKTTTAFNCLKPPAPK